MDVVAGKNMNISNLIGYRDKLLIKFQKPGITVKCNFFRLLAISQEAGLGIRQSLKGILVSESNYVMKKVIVDMIERLNGGSMFSSTLEFNSNIFDSQEIELIKSSEMMGNMPQVLNDIATELENMEKIYKEIKSAMTYPIILIVFAILAVAILMIKVIPVIVGVFPSFESLPIITKYVIWTSNFLIAKRPVLGGTAIGSVVVFIITYNKVLAFKKLIDKLMIKVPVVKDVTRTYYMYRFSKILGDFYKAGVSPVKALQQMTNMFFNFYYQKKAIEIKKDLEAGFSFADCVQGSDLFDPVLIQIIVVGEGTGNLSKVLLIMSDFYRGLLSYKTKILVDMIQPIMMLIVGTLVGLIVASIFLPMADLVNTIGT